VYAEIDPLLMMRPALRLLILHQSKRLLGAEKRAGQVDIDDRLPLFDGQLLDRHATCRDAGVVEQHVEPSEGVVRGGEQRAHGRRVGDVGRHRERARTMRTGIRHRLCQQRLAPAGEDDGKAGFEEGQRDGPANSRSRTRYNRHFRGCAHAAILVSSLKDGTLTRDRS
jgi:hypothetical protein